MKKKSKTGSKTKKGSDMSGAKQNNAKISKMVNFMSDPEEELRKKIETESVLETRYFSTDELKDKIEEMLLSEDYVTEIRSLEIAKRGDKFIINANLKLKYKGLGMKGIIVGILENKEGFIDLDQDVKIHAGPINKVLMNLLIKPKIRNIARKIKEYIEDEKMEDGQNYEVNSIQIKNGRLEVVFRK